MSFGREHIEELRLEVEEKKTRMALRQLEEQEREQAEQEKARRLAEQDELRRQQREIEVEERRRDREREERTRQDLEDRKKQQEFDRWQLWSDRWIQYALTNLISSPDVRSRFAGEIQSSVQQALERLGPLGPSRPRAIIEQVVSTAVRQAIEPWLRQQEIEQAIKQASKELPFEVRHLSDIFPPTEWEARATSAAREAITHLAPNVSLAEVRAATVGAGQPVAQEYQRRGEQERGQQKRAEQADTYLQNLLPYLQELQAAPDGVDFEGKIFEDEQRIRNAIRPKLVAEVAGLDYVSGPRRVRELAREWKPSS